MARLRLAIVQMATVSTLSLACLWASTEWVARRFADKKALGPATIHVAGHALHEPWDLFIWWYQLGRAAPHIFDTAGLFTTAGAIMASGVAALVGAAVGPRREKSTTYGSARWSTARDVWRAGLMEPGGVFLGRLGSAYLRHDGPEHVLAIAPTRSGKGVGLVIPTLLSWTGSAIIHDLKGENWRLTAGWRARFSHCLLFNPTDPQSACYNPLLDVRRGPGEIRDVQNLADMLVDPVITTDRRSYHLALTSTAHTAMAAVSWTYPADALISLKASVDPSQRSGPGDNPPSLAVDRLNFGYRIAGDAPWRPLRAFDDGRQTFIEFPPAISAGEAPPLFIVGAKGAPELVNYRMQGRFYVVDRLFDRAELRLGVKPQKIVRIIRDGSGPSGARAS